MSEIIYFGSMLVSVICTILLTKSYRQSRARVLLWIALSFGFLALSNIFVFLDVIVFPEVNMWGPIVRNALLACAGSVLVAGLIWELS